MAGRKFGHIVTIETRNKISMAFIGRKLTPAHRLKISEANKGKVRSIKSREKYKEGAKKRANYRGGISSKEHLERDKFRKSVQKRVFERDDYICQLCGQRGGDLHVDHIQSWKDYIELRFDINNCRTLCRDCHYYITFHRPITKITRWSLKPRTEKIR